MRAHLLIRGALGPGEAASLAYVQQELDAILGRPVFDSILLRLDTSGGSLSETTAIVALLQGCKLSIAASLIEGRADSLGLWLALLGERVYARPNASALLHHLSADEGSDERNVKLAAKFDAALLRVYSRKTGHTPEELARLFDMSARVGASDLLALGLVDSILPYGWPPEADAAAVA